MDPLADVLDLSRVRGALLGNVTASSPWGLDLPRSGGAAFHAFTSGTAWLQVDGYEYDHDVAQPLLSLLPPVLHVPADPVAGTKIAAVVTLLAGELGVRDAGARA